MAVRYIVADWDKHKEQLSAVRHEVFVKGQNVPLELEQDESDSRYSHILALDGDIPIGTARLTTDGHIGRVAVLKEYRKLGIGRELIRQIEEIAFELGFDEVELGAQLHAVPFYEKLGYRAFGNIYMDAGIEHRHMKKTL
ncbi:GNAT family N-acetyltransferase [Spirochaeta isovalerica]|uniref:Putative GNAT family N-acyltransferase n=1 Tax=Spirochaeta isovalerica TaxID=150 RepID=A0A841R4Q9_9SPIO|nr:GNAT family N-acetyltransferase [Spirochaeta isovalerica]MBB6478381.1 putative GNAT family N-acyltransferase [Spirochaeta isovalerica]